MSAGTLISLTFLGLLSVQKQLSSKYKVEREKRGFIKTPHLCFFYITCVACHPFLAGFPITGNEIQFLSSDGRRLREFVLVREGFSLPDNLTCPDGTERVI